MLRIQVRCDSAAKVDGVEVLHLVRVRENFIGSPRFGVLLGHVSNQVVGAEKNGECRHVDGTLALSLRAKRRVLSANHLAKPATRGSHCACGHVASGWGEAESRAKLIFPRRP